MKAFTIGYGGRAPGELIKLLLSAGVATVADVRLRPDRASMGAFVKAKSPDKGIETLLAKAGIGYRSLPELGNVFLVYEDWQKRYAELMKSAGHLLTTRLAGLPPPLCLLCAEKSVANCHRRQIAEFLTSHGWEIEHLDGA